MKYKKIKHLKDEVLESFANGEIPQAFPHFIAECITEINRRKKLGIWKPKKL